MEKTENTNTILVVDDNEVNVLVIQKILEKAHLGKIITARNGKEALQKTEETEPNLVVLDIIMPEMDGYGYCEAVRKLGKFKELPIIVQTALTEPAQRLKAFKAGATDLVSKPIDAQELVARVKVHMEIHNLLNRLQEYKKNLEEDLGKAQLTQILLLPSDEEIALLKKHYDLDIASYFEPCTSIGGDIWGVYPLAERKAIIYSVDFSGHGVSAALNIFRFHATMERLVKHISDPGRLLTILNEEVYQLIQRGDYATMFLGCIDFNLHKMQYAAAATPDPILVVDGKIDFIDGSGLPLAVLPNTTYSTKEVDFPQNSVLITYSDAFIESENSEGAFLEKPDIEDTILKAATEINISARTIIQALLEKFRHHTKNTAISDDLTLCVFKSVG